MEFSYKIIYVPDVSASLTFFENPFGLRRRFLHESGTYGELDTGETTLAFASHTLAGTYMPAGYVAADASPQPLGDGSRIRNAGRRGGPRHRRGRRCEGNQAAPGKAMGSGRFICTLPRWDTG